MMIDIEHLIELLDSHRFETDSNLIALEDLTSLAEAAETPEEE